MLVELCEGDSVTYRIDCSGLARVRIAASAAEGLSADGGSGYVSIGQCGGEAVGQAGREAQPGLRVGQGAFGLY